MQKNNIPNGTDLLATLIKLLAEQNSIHIEFTVKGTQK